MARRIRSFSPVKCQTWVISGQLVQRHSSAWLPALSSTASHLSCCGQADRLLPWTDVARAEAQCHAAVAKLPPLLEGVWLILSTQGQKYVNQVLKFCRSAKSFPTSRWQRCFMPGLKRTAGTGSNSQRPTRFTNIIIPNAPCLTLSSLKTTSEHSVARSFTST